MRGLEQIAGHRLLFLNWRDLGNPEAGGAEAYTEEIARRLAAAGAEVTLFTGKYPGAAPFDWAHEYLVAREGGRYGVYLAAARYLRKHARYYDAVVDFQNGIPFFAPLWVPAGTVVVCAVRHVHQSQFDMYFRWSMNRVGRLLEGTVSAMVYKRTPFVAVSPSTGGPGRHRRARAAGLPVPQAARPWAAGQVPAGRAGAHGPGAGRAAPLPGAMADRRRRGGAVRRRALPAPSRAAELVAVPAVLVLLRRGPLPRLLALFYLAGAAALGYAVTLGTLEENELYLLFVPSLLILPVAAALWLRGRGGTRPARAVKGERGGGRGSGAFTAAVALLACVNLTTCVLWLLQPDNGMQRLRQYLAAHVPAGTVIASVDDSPPLTAGTTYWALSDRYRVGPWAGAAQRARHHVRYVVIPWMEIGQGYSYLTEAQARNLVRPGRLLFSFHERTYGDLALYRLPPAGG